MEDNEILKAIENNTIYDLVSKKYNKMSKEQLKNLLLEFIYSHYQDLSNAEIIENYKERYI
jgi:hypothetical protein